MMAKKKNKSARIRRGQRKRKQAKVSKRKTRGYYIDKKRAHLMQLRNSGMVPGRNGITVEFPEELWHFIPEVIK